MSPGATETVGEPSCPWCGGQRRLPGARLSEGRHVTRCVHCDAGALSPPPGAGELAAAYAETYYGRGNRRFLPVIEALVGNFHRHRARAITRALDAKPLQRARRGLEVGCGRGLLLGELRRLGWEVEGVEVSDLAATHARETLGINVTVGEFADLPHEEESFDCVVFWHVLEHLREPAIALDRARRILRPGGLLVIAVPNLDSWQARFGGSRWFHLDPPRHLHHLSALGLEGWLSRHRFAVRRTSHLSWEQNPYGWLQTLENRIGLPQNHLYETLKGHSARSLPTTSSPVLATPLALACAPLLAPLALLLTLLESAARRGGTIEIYAHRV